MSNALELIGAGYIALLSNRFGRLESSSGCIYTLGKFSKPCNMPFAYLCISWKWIKSRNALCEEIAFFIRRGCILCSKALNYIIARVVLFYNFARLFLAVVIKFVCLELKSCSTAEYIMRVVAWVACMCDLYDLNIMEVIWLFFDIVPNVYE